MTQIRPYPLRRAAGPCHRSQQGHRRRHRGAAGRRGRRRGHRGPYPRPPSHPAGQPPGHGGGPGHPRRAGGDHCGRPLRPRGPGPHRPPGGRRARGQHRHSRQQRGRRHLPAAGRVPLAPPAPHLRRQRRGPVRADAGRAPRDAGRREGWIVNLSSATARLRPGPPFIQGAGSAWPFTARPRRR